MKNISDLPRVSLGVYPTPFYKLENISRQAGRNIWIKRDDLCGVALGGNKVRKLEFLLAEAQAQGCDTVFTTGGAQSNHAMLTAACASRLGMKPILLLKKRGVTERSGNLILDEIYGAEVRLIDTDHYEDIYAEMHRVGDELEKAGHKCCYIPVGGSTPLGAVGYVNCVREIAMPGTPKKAPPTRMATITHRLERPVVSPKILGPMILPSTCCRAMIKIRKYSAFSGETSRMSRRLGTAPKKGPKKGMMLVTPTMVLMSGA